MVIVETYLKINKEFVKIDEFEGVVADPMYVEGAIYLKINGKEILTLDLWDDVNWLWGFIVSGFEDLQEQPEWTTGFPDQPIKLTFRLDKNNGKMQITVNIPQGNITQTKAETRYAVAPLNEFLTAMNDAGQDYFNLISTVGGEDGSREAKRLNEAIKDLKKLSF